MAIIGRIEHLRTFYTGNIFWLKAMEYFESILTEGSLDSKRLLALPMDAFERHYITDDIFALEQRFVSKERSQCFIESHKKYVDIQMIYSGQELMEFGDIARLIFKSVYDPSRDLITYLDSKNLNQVLLRNGDFAVYFPGDAHLGCQRKDDSVECFKTVIKMPVKYLL